MRSVGGVRNLAHNHICFFLPSSSLVLLLEWKDLRVVLLGQLPQTGSVYVAGQGVPSSCAAGTFPVPEPGCQDRALPPPMVEQNLIEAMCGVLAQGERFIKAYPLSSGRQASSS